VSANVRCAGNPDMQYVRVSGNRAMFSNGGPCGWKAHQPPGRDLKPCPQCGGRVEVIPEED
jgi:hypothetical protein